MESKHTEAAPDRRRSRPILITKNYVRKKFLLTPPSIFFRHQKVRKEFALRSGAASVCLLSMTFFLGASRLGLFTFEIHARIRWNWDPFSAWGASVSGVG